jgi:hypothetical protein
MELDVAGRTLTSRVHSPQGRPPRSNNGSNRQSSEESHRTRPFQRNHNVVRGWPCFASVRRLSIVPSDGGILTGRAPGARGTLI